MIIHHFSEKDHAMMNLALEEARQAVVHGDVPVGAVLMDDQTGEVLASCHNTREMNGNALGHAEISVINEVCQKRKTWRLSDCTLYVTLEPCPMCAGAIMAARIPRIVYGAKDAVAGAMGSVWAIQAHPNPNAQTLVETGLLEEESKTIMRDFFKERRNRVQKDAE